MLPAQRKTDQPDGESSGGIGQAPSCSAHMSGDAEAEVVEQRNTESDRNPRPEDTRGIDHLIPTSWEVKKGRTRRHGWLRHEWHE